MHTDLFDKVERKGNNQTRERKRVPCDVHHNLVRDVYRPCPGPATESQKHQKRCIPFTRRHKWEIIRQKVHDSLDVKSVEEDRNKDKEIE